MWNRPSYRVDGYAQRSDPSALVDISVTVLIRVPGRYRGAAVDSVKAAVAGLKETIAGTTFEVAE